MATRLGEFAYVAISVAFAALAVAVTGWSEPRTETVVSNGDPPTVIWVLPGGPVWQDGMRAGQVVVGLTSTTDPTAWRLVTSDGNETFTTSYESIRARLRNGLPLALGAGICALASVVVIRRGFLAGAVAAASVVLGGQALLDANLPLESSAAVVCAISLPALWVWRWGRQSRALRSAVLGAAVAIAGVWLATRAAIPEAYPFADLLRASVLVLSVVAMVVSLADWRHWRQKLLAVDSRRSADLVALATVVAIFVFVAVLTELPLLILVVLSGIAVLAYPKVRRRLAGAIDELLLGDLRHRASIQAVEEERGRIARDLHDAPLQEIAAAIRGLERRGGADPEADLLRGVAGHIRRVTTDLRPPVLDDLGLGAGISFVIEQARQAAPGVTITGRVTPDDPVAPRPPADVELAVFRIVQEAVDNALHHANAANVSITATVQPHFVSAEVRDDGRGLPTDARRRAVRDGHLGLLSMSDRAGLIGANLVIDSKSGQGTCVEVHWEGAS